MQRRLTQRIVCASRPTISSPRCLLRSTSAATSLITRVPPCTSSLICRRFTSSRSSSTSSSSPSQSWSPLRGMYDYTPADVARYRSLESSFSSLVSQYAYGEIRTPILERSDLFARTLGATSDVVSKEMFAFVDHETPSVLRPEATASVARAVLNRGITATPMPLRYYYSGSMFRRERPQAGRQRSFQQFGCELIGASEIDADIEIIQTAADCLRVAGVSEYVTLHINSLGDNETRENYTKALSTLLAQHQQHLSEDSRARLERGNILRILDSKDAKDQNLLNGRVAGVPPIPLLVDSLTPQASQRFKFLLARLKAIGIQYELNPFLVRGLDYYQHTCFEFVLNTSKVRERMVSLGATQKQLQGIPSKTAILAGGRYDTLFTTLGGPTTPAIGWAAGIDRIILLQDLVKQGERPDIRPTPIGVILIEESVDAATASSGQSSQPSLTAAHAALCAYIRNGCRLHSNSASSSSSSSSSLSFPPSYSVIRSFHPSMSKQLKYLTRPNLLQFGVDTEQPQIVLFLGTEELKKNEITIKFLKEGRQLTCTIGQLESFIKRWKETQGRENIQLETLTSNDINFETLTKAMLGL